MSDWTNEKHRAARVLVNTAPREFVDDLARTNALHQALDEIERLRAESGGPSDDVLERALNGWFHDEPEGILEGYPDETTARMRAALTAALTPKENQS